MLYLSFRRTIAGLAVAPATALTIACSSDAGTGPREPVASVVVAPAARDLEVGDSVRLTAAARDRNDRMLPDRPVTWSGGPASAVSVSPSGLVTAVGAGAATITASSEGKEGTAKVTVTWSQAPVASITLDRTTVTLAEGETTQLVATLRDANGRPLTGRDITWTSADPTVAWVTTAGVVTGIRAQTTTIRASTEGLAAEARISVSANYPFDLVFSGSPTGLAVARLYLLRLGTEPQPVLPPTALPGWTLSRPAVSPDGRTIAFSAQLGGDAYVYAVNADGTNLRRLTTGGDEAQPTWSPDGTRLAYVSWPPGPDADIWVMNADGSDPVNLTGHLGFADQFNPAWSPELPGGSRLAFTSGDYLRSQILTMRPDGSDVREVTALSDGLDAEPAWSPDGTRIAFTREDSESAGFDVWLVEATGANPGALLRLPLAQFNPSWSPDGRMIAFTSNHEPSSLERIYTVWSDGGTAVRRTSGPGYAVHPTWRVRP